MRTGGDSGGEVPALRILVTVTFNPNQLRSHMLPLLALPEVEAVTLVCDVEPPPLPKVRAVVPPGVLVRLLGRAGAKLVVCLRVARRERPDWVVGFYFAPHGLNARVVGATTRTKSLYHMIGGEQEWRGGGWRSENSVLGRLPFRSAALERILVRLIGGCTAVATMGELGRAALVERGVDPSRVVVLPPSVDTNRFAPRSRSDPTVHDVVTVGALSPRKRQADLVRATAELHRRGRSVNVALVGAGPMEPTLRALAEELGVGENIDFLGFRDDVESIYRVAGVFVLSSSWEGLPISMLEAMASGLPVVVSDVGEIGGFVRHGENGFLFPVGRVDLLVEHLDRLLDDEALRRTLGANAARDVRAAASVEAVASAYRSLFARSTSTSLAPATAPDT